MIPQSDFGAYDPRFIGIQINIDSKDAFKFFKSCYGGGVYPLDASDPQMTQKLWLGSVVEHETRHFHDMLLSPYSSKLLRLRRNVITNFDQIFLDIVAGLAVTGANCLPVPLQNWLELEAQERKAFLFKINDYKFFKSSLSAMPLPIISNMITHPINVKTWSSHHKFEISPTPQHRDDIEGLVSEDYPDLSMFEDENFVRRLAILKDNYDQIDFFLRGCDDQGSNSYQPWEVFEVSAVLCQMASARLTFTGMSDADFLKTFAKLNPTYLRLLNPFILIRDPEPGQIGRALGLIATWSIFSGHIFEGKFYKDWSGTDYQACPAVRYREAVAFLKKFGLPKSSMAAHQVFKLLDEHTGFTPWQMNLNIGHALNETSIENIEKAMKSDASPWMRSLHQAFKTFVKKQGLLFSMFGSVLEEYVDPGKYVQIVQQLPAPVTLFKLGNHAALPKNGFSDNPEDKRSQRITVETASDVGGEECVLKFLVCGPGEEMRRESIDFWEFYQECRRLDFMFCKHHRSEATGVEIASWVPKNDLQFVELF